MHEAHFLYQSGERFKFRDVKGVSDAPPLVALPEALGSYPGGDGRLESD